MKKTVFLSVFVLLLQMSLLAQTNVNNIQLPELKQPHTRTIINVPDIDGYITLKGDFHMHTIFSDGIVWPTTRITEAWEEGLDVIAITDHIEYRPNIKYLKMDHNSSYEIAQKAAIDNNILLVKGAEITRDMAPGHFNALFIEDADKLETETPLDAIMEAHQQGAFIIWNHPGWKAQQPDTCKRFAVHNKLITDGIINGIEVFNEAEWYQMALNWCIKDSLTVFGNSDIHDINAHYYSLEKYHRPLTLVFARERTLEGVEEALRSGRTAARFSKYVAGKEDILKQLYEKSIQTEVISHTDSEGNTMIEITNNSDFIFEYRSESNIVEDFTIAPGTVFLLRVNKEEAAVDSLSFTISNWYTDMLKNPEISLKL